MARRLEKNKAIELRKKGYSYSQIKERMRVSKSTLSLWLSDIPLSPRRMRELRDNNPHRIENFINTMRLKREEKYQRSFEKVSKDIGSLSKRDLFIGGLFLYWAEGGKTKPNTFYLANTDPEMLKVFLKWIKILGISKKKVRVKLHLYSDMNLKKEILFWQKELGVKKDQFIKPYIKQSSIRNLSYRKGFGHGTCNLIVNQTEPTRYILMGVRYIIKVLNYGKLKRLHL
ncbi:MAG: hypothetical protein AAB690_00795 [Patescibacteria group bacterium]